MNKEYICEKDSIIEVLNEIDNFIYKVQGFNEKHNNAYSYKININYEKDKKKWVVNLNLKRNGE